MPSHFSRTGILLAILALAPADASADQSFTVGADTLVFSQPGSLVRVSATGSPGLSYLAYEASTTVRVHAERSDADGQWELLDTGQNYCALYTMNVGLTWRFLDDDQGRTRTATVAAYENVGVPAGDFMAYRVDISLDDQPGVVTESLWFTVNVGMIRDLEFDGGSVVRRLVLENYSVSGLGFFPLVQGNTWNYTDVSVDARASSIGALKGRFEPDRP